MTVSFIRAIPAIAPRSFESRDDAMAYIADMFQVEVADLQAWDGVDGEHFVAPAADSGEGLVAEITE